MSKGFIKLISKQIIPGFNTLRNLPEQNKINYLISNGIAKSITMPDDFINGLLVSINGGKKEDLVLLLTSREYFESIKDSFNDSSFQWLEVI